VRKINSQLSVERSSGLTGMVVQREKKDKKAEMFKNKEKKRESNIQEALILR